MADMRIDRGIQTPQDFGEVQDQLGLPQEQTSLPEWQGWDRVENAAIEDSSILLSTDLRPDMAPVLDQLRTEPEYENMVDLDEKSFILDVMGNVSKKLDSIAEQRGSEKLSNFRETLNELLDLYQTAYSRQLGNVKG
jgi:hypothetical protein